MLLTDSRTTCWPTFVKPGSDGPCSKCLLAHSLMANLETLRTSWTRHRSERHRITNPCTGAGLAALVQMDCQSSRPGDGPRYAGGISRCKHRFDGIRLWPVLDSMRDRPQANVGWRCLNPRPRFVDLAHSPVVHLILRRLAPRTNLPHANQGVRYSS